MVKGSTLEYTGHITGTKRQSHARENTKIDSLSLSNTQQDPNQSTKSIKGIEPSFMYTPPLMLRGSLGINIRTFDPTSHRSCYFLMSNRRGSWKFDVGKLYIIGCEVGCFFSLVP